MGGWLDEPQNLSEWLAEEKILMLVPGIEAQLVSCTAHSPVTIPITMLRYQVKNLRTKICSIHLCYLNKRMIITSILGGYFMLPLRT